MKKFLNKNGLIIGISLILLVVFILGNIYSSAVINHRAEELIDDQERYNDAVEIISVQYNFDLETLGENVYIVEFTFEEETYTTYVDETFCYVQMVEGEALDLMVMSAVKHHLESEALIESSAYIISYDSTTKTIVMETIGYKGLLIQVEMVLNETLDGIISYSVISAQTYDNPYNEGYLGDPVPVVENEFLEDYMTGNDFDTVGGATITERAVLKLTTLLDLFLDSLEGGN